MYVWDGPQRQALLQLVKKEMMDERKTALLLSHACSNITIEYRYYPVSVYIVCGIIGYTCHDNI